MGSRLSEREINTDCRTDIGCRIESQMPFVTFDYALAYHQAKAMAFFFGGPKTGKTALVLRVLDQAFKRLDRHQGSRFDTPPVSRQDDKTVCLAH